MHPVAIPLHERLKAVRIRSFVDKESLHVGEAAPAMINSRRGPRNSVQESLKKAGTALSSYLERGF